MIDLKCKLTNCKFNKDCNCNANGITVKDDATCASFEPINVSTKSKDQLNMPLVRKYTDVNCSADCIFKKSGKCIANGITVVDETGKKTKADCSTFMPK